MHRQRQLIHAVAAVQRLQAVPHDVCARCRRDCHIGVAFPYVRLVGTRLANIFVVVGRIHRQVQLEYTVTTGLGLQAVPHNVRAGRRRNRHAGMTFPNVRLVVARLGFHHIIVARVHRQRQLIHAVAVVHRLQAVPQDVRAGSRRNRHIGVALPYVRLVVASRHGRFTVESRIYNQRKFIYAVAAISGQFSVIIDTARGSVYAMPIIRKFILAQVHRISIRVSREHRQRQFEHTIAMVHRLQAIPHDVCAGSCRNRHIGMTYPSIRFVVARLGCRLFIIGRVHRQRQLIDAVAGVHRLQAVPHDMRARNCRDCHIGVARPYVRLVGTCLAKIFIIVSRVYRQRQLIDAVTGIHCLQAVPYDVRAGSRRNRHTCVARPCVRLVVARRGRLFVVVARVHRQRQLKDAVAGVHRLQAVPQNIRTGRCRNRHVQVAFPYVRHVVARRSSLFIVICRIHRQRQLIHAVAVVHRLQAVPQDVGARSRRDCHIGVAFPYIRHVVAR